MKAEYRYAGYGWLFAYAKFHEWAAKQRVFPMPETVMSEFDVSRATSHRWLNIYAGAACVERPLRDSRHNIRAQA